MLTPLWCYLKVSLWTGTATQLADTWGTGGPTWTLRRGRPDSGKRRTEVQDSDRPVYLTQLGRSRCRMLAKLDRSRWELRPEEEASLADTLLTSEASSHPSTSTHSVFSTPGWCQAPEPDAAASSLLRQNSAKHCIQDFHNGLCLRDSGLVHQFVFLLTTKSLASHQDPGLALHKMEVG